MYQVKRKSDGEYWNVESADAARKEFGPDADMDTLREYAPRVIEYVALGSVVYAVYDNGDERSAVMCKSQAEAIETSVKLSME